MTQKEKAQAYDEAIKRAEKFNIDDAYASQGTIVKSIFPQLIKESDDEKIRKEIVDFIQWAEDRGVTRHDDHQAKRPAVWIAYLEKQKAARNESNDENEDERIRLFICDLITHIFWGTDWDISKKDCLAYLEKQKERKPILEVFGFKVGDAVRLKDGDGRKHIIKSFEEVEGLHGPNFYHVEFEDNSARDGIYPGEEYPNGYYTQMEKFKDEQKPTEWSDEDNNILEQIIMDYENEIRKLSGIAIEKQLIYTYKKRINLLKSLRNRPKASDTWKPSEKEITAFENMLKGEFPDGIFPGVTLSELLTKLKKLYYNEQIPYWKPSEEQMKALKNVAYGKYQNGDGPLLRELCEQLGKL